MKYGKTYIRQLDARDNFLNLDYTPARRGIDILNGTFYNCTINIIAVNKENL